MCYLQHTSSVSTIKLSGPTYSSQNVRQIWESTLSKSDYLVGHFGLGHENEEMLTKNLIKQVSQTSTDSDNENEQTLTKNLIKQVSHISSDSDNENEEMLTKNIYRLVSQTSLYMYKRGLIFFLFCYRKFTYEYVYILPVGIQALYSELSLGF
jgi:hypothetical protein